MQYWFYICFYWYFVNQWCCWFICCWDGIFNYSFDVYCIKYDEVIGFCLEGDECLFLYRIIGDIECRYYFCYYKIGICIYEIDLKGNCIKNGLYCVFVYGFYDFCFFVYDIREFQVMEVLQNGQIMVEGSIEGQLVGVVSYVMIEKIFSEEFWW